MQTSVAAVEHRNHPKTPVPPHDIPFVSLHSTVLSQIYPIVFPDACRHLMLSYTYPFSDDL